MNRAMPQRKHVILVGVLAVCLFGAGQSLSSQPGPASSR